MNDLFISFDIGLKTCSVAVERYDLSLVPVAPTVKYLKGGEGTDEMKEFVKQVGRLGTVVHLEKRELGDKKTFFTNSAFHNLYAWVRELDTHLQQAQIILIEQQMKCNNIALALMHHLFAFLLIHYPTKTVKLYPSKNKTRILGAPLKVENDDGKLERVTKYQRKKWSTVCANELLLDRKDSHWHNYIFVTNKSKKDDLSDVLMQTLSYVVDQVAVIKKKRQRKNPNESNEQSDKDTPKPKKPRKKPTKLLETSPNHSKQLTEDVAKPKRPRKKTVEVAEVPTDPSTDALPIQPVKKIKRANKPTTVLNV